jgi:nucleoid DNA-binding protein/cell division septation protein DedD
MEQYILELIRSNNRVIIPNFGAFIVAKEKGFTILFNNFLSFNDGLLVEHVMSKENVDKLEATDRVTKFVERINETLDTTGSYELKDLGVFTKDSTGILRFTQGEELNEAFIDTQEVEGESEELLDIETSAPEGEIEEQHNESTIVMPPPVNEIIPPTDSEPKEEPAKESETTKERKDPQQEEKAKERMALFVVLFILIPIIGFGIYYFFFTNPSEVAPVKAKQEIIKQKPISKSKSKTEDNGIVAGPESTVEKKTVKAEVITPAVKKTTITTRRHYIITGSFKEEKNANKYVDMMRGKGFSSPVAIPHNGMYLVGVESFSSLTKAMSRQEKMLSQYKLESWILTVK